MPDITPESLARLITDDLLRIYQGAGCSIGWIDDNDLRHVVIDGTIDMVALSRVIIDALAAADP